MARFLSTRLTTLSGVLGLILISFHLQGQDVTGAGYITRLAAFTLLLCLLTVLLCVVLDKLFPATDASEGHLPLLATLAGSFLIGTIATTLFFL